VIEVSCPPWSLLFSGGCDVVGAESDGACGSGGGGDDDDGDEDC